MGYPTKNYRSCYRKCGKCNSCSEPRGMETFTLFNAFVEVSGAIQLKEISDTHVKVKNIVEYFKKSTQATLNLLSTEERDMPVRWNSTFHMFERILKVKEAVISTLAILNYEKQQIYCMDSKLLELMGKRFFKIK